MRRGLHLRGVVAALGAVVVACAAQAHELEDLLRESLAHPSNVAAEQRVHGAREQLGAANERYLGSGSVSADTARTEDDRFVGVFSPAALADPIFARDVSRYGAAWSVPLDLSGAMAAGRRAAGDDLEAARLARSQAQLLKLHDTTSAYVRLQALQRQQRVLEIQRARVGQTVERVTRQVDIQQASTAELRAAQADFARVDSEAVRLAGALGEQQAALEEAAGRRVIPSAVEIAIPPWPTAEPAQFLPDAVSAMQMAAARERAREAARSLWPQLSLGADWYRYQARDQSPEIWSVGARVALPIDPSGWRRASAASAVADSAASDREAARRVARREWTRLRAAYDAARADAQALEKETAAREEVVRVQAELQRVGMASLEEFLRQQRDLREAESRLGEARATAVVAWSAGQVLAGTAAESYIVAATMAPAATPTVGTSEVEDPRLARGRRLTADLARQLKDALVAALASGGPVGALDTCRVEAPAIAARLREPGLGVGRTALRVRNPANAPDAQQRAVLEDFQRRLTAGEPADALEFLGGSGRDGLYMKPIVMQPMCTTCHGGALAPDLKQALSERYPRDEATGFEPGQLRGAFVVRWSDEPR